MRIAQSFIIAFLFLGCATYQNRIQQGRDQIQKGDCLSGLKNINDLVEKNDGDQLVFLMELGSALQICKDYTKSNEVFLKADKLSEKLDYHSITRLAGAALLNEEFVQYKGDTFEKLFINVMMAINYLQLGLFDDALVEVRRIDEKFKKYNSDNKKKFELNSFSQYLSGIIWELDGKYDDACISYKAAYRLDVSYHQVGLDAMRSCWLAKRSLDFSELSKDISPTYDELKIIKQKNINEIVVLFMQGWGPLKQPRPDNHVFPQLVPSLSITYNFQLTNKNDLESKILSKNVYDVQKAAIQTLNDDYFSLMGRRAGSYVAKEVFADQLRQQDKAVGEIARLFLLASERADLRQWSMLPASFQVLRIPIKDKKAQYLVQGLDRYANISENFEDIYYDSSQKKRIYLIRGLR